MRRQTQLIRHDPSNDQWGDCFRTCIAIMLGVDAAEVPHFCDGGGTWETISGRTMIQDWLEDRNMKLLRMTLNAEHDCEDLFGILDFWHRMNRGTPVAVTVQSVGCNHVIVCRNRSVYCDPATGKSEKSSKFVAPACDETGRRYWELWFLGGLPPKNEEGRNA